MPTPSKPLALVKKHLTNAEKDQRKNAENLLITGQTIKEWPTTRGNPVAHKHFLRIVSLYRAIGKNDALTEPIINRYCVMQAESEAFETKREECYKMAVELREMLNSGDENVDRLVIIDKIDKLYQSALSFDRQIQAKRKMLLDIERESLMTLAAQMRSIPKKVEEKSDSSGVAAFKRRRAQ